MKGAERVAERLKQELGIELGEITTDGLFTLLGTRCLGNCGLAAVLIINDDVHGKVTCEHISGILEQYFKGGK